MITKKQVQESLDRVSNDSYRLTFIPPIDPYSYKSLVSDKDWNTIVSVVGDDFLNVDSYNWSDKERTQMETIIDILANILDL